MLISLMISQDALGSFLERLFMVILFLSDLFLKGKDQFGKTIQILWSYNAKECFSTLFNSLRFLMAAHVKSSCPHMSRKNSVAKQKHCHLLDSTPTLLINIRTPLKFCGDKHYSHYLLIVLYSHSVYEFHCFSITH